LTAVKSGEGKSCLLSISVLAASRTYLFHPDVFIDERRLPLFIVRAGLRDLIAGLAARATGDAELLPDSWTDFPVI
jgi:hypothetical protein